MAHTFITCSFCGKSEDLDKFSLIDNPLVEAMSEEQLCFECAYWKRWIANPEPNAIVIGNDLWVSVTPFVKPSTMQSRSKSLKFMVDLKSQEVFASSTLMLKARIPERFAAELPSSHKFITRDDYLRLSNFDAEMCLSKGCFDRYHCVWYNADIAEPDEPWNRIPSNYKIGSEDCPSFVNKNILHND